MTIGSASAIFSNPVRSFVRRRVSERTDRRATRCLAGDRAGENVLVVSPTGTGKTLAAFLAIIDRILRDVENKPEGVRCVYVSPLKSLGNDIERNLNVPLEAIRILLKLERARLSSACAPATPPPYSTQAAQSTPGIARHHSRKPLALAQSNRLARALANGRTYYYR